MKFLDWQTLQPKFVETIASSRFSTQAASFLGLSSTGLPDAAVIKAVIAELTDAVAKLGGGAQGPAGTPTLTITPAAIDLIVGGVVNCTVTALDGKGQPIAGVSVALSTSDPKFAVVEDTTGTGIPAATTDAAGTAQFIISGVAAGVTSLVAIGSGLTALADVFVGGGAITLTLSPAAITVQTGAATPLLAHLVDGAGNAMAGQEIDLTSSDPSIAAVPASVTTDANGAAQISVTGVAVGSAVISATPTVSGATQTSDVSVRAPVAASAQITIAYTDFSTSHQSATAAQKQMAFIASKTNHKWKVMNGLTPSGGYPSNVAQIFYSLMEQTKCYDGNASLLTQQSDDYEAFCAAHGLNPEDGYLHYPAGATTLADIVLSIDAQGFVTMKYDTQTRASVYAVGQQVTIAGNSAPGCNGTFTVVGVQAPATPGGSAIIHCNMTNGQSGTGGTMTRVADGTKTKPNRLRSGNPPFTPFWHVYPASSVRLQYELDRLARNVSGRYGLFIDSMSNNIFPDGTTTLEYNPANSAQWHDDMAALIAALRATLGTGPWRYQINTGAYADSGIAQLIAAAGSAHMESILKDHSGGFWPGTNQDFVAARLAAGENVEILNDVSVVDTESSFGPGPYVNDPLPPVGNINAAAYTIQSWINALMVWDGGAGGGELAVNLWNDLWTQPTPDTGGIDNKWFGLLDYSFGVPTGASTSLATGVDPLGQGVSVHMRPYGNNLVVYRSTPSGATSWADAAGFVVNLPASSGAGGKWQRVKLDGTLDVAISTVTLHPMMGVMLVPAGGSVALAPASGSVKVGQTIPLTVTVLDATGSPVGGQVVGLASSVPADLTVPTSVTTDATGTATFNATGVAVGSSNVTATANGVSSGVVPITVTSPSTVTASDAFTADSITLAGGAAVTAWSNDADGTRNAAQTDTTEQPVFRKAILNGLPGVFYPSAAVTQNLKYTSLPHTAWTVFAVIQKPTGTSTTKHGVIHATLGWRLQVLDTVSSGAIPLQFTSKRSTTNGVWQSDAVVLSAGSIVQVSYDSSSLANTPTIKVNGNALTVTQTTAPVGTQVSSAGDAYIGNDPPSAANDAYYGYIFALEVYDGVLGTSDEAAQGQRLGTKWGVANSY